MGKKYSVAVEIVVLAEDEKDALKKTEDMISGFYDLAYIKSHKVLVIMDKGEKNGEQE